MTDGEQVQTFVIIGTTAISVDEEEAKSSAALGRAWRTVGDYRSPARRFLVAAAREIGPLRTEFLDFPGFDVDPANSAQMTEDVKPLSRRSRRC